MQRELENGAQQVFEGLLSIDNKPSKISTITLNDKGFVSVSL